MTPELPENPHARTQLIQTFDLPDCGNSRVGPIHTIISGLQDGFILSDEMNHRIMALNSSGELLWHRSQKGRAPGELHYPRGISLGPVESEGRSIQCLGVADSWNRRVQFFDFDGNPVALWDRVGAIPFGEIADVKFIGGKFHAKPKSVFQNFWMVLDKGKHKVYGLGLEGSLLFELGSCFPPTMEEAWAYPIMLMEESAGPLTFTANFPEFAFAYYPERILGTTDSSLYLWEPFSGRLKQILGGHFFPLRISPETELEWTAADKSGFLAWQPSAARMWRFDPTLKAGEQAEIVGAPIASDLPVEQFWIQDRHRLSRFQWRSQLPLPDASWPGSPLARTIEAELQRVDSAAMQRAMERVIGAIDQTIAVAEEIKEWNSNPSAGPTRISEISSLIVRLPEQRAAHENSLYQALHPWCLAMLEYRLMERKPGEIARQIEEARNRWLQCAAPLRAKKFRLEMLRSDLAAAGEMPDPLEFQDPALVDAWRQSILAIGIQLTKLQFWIECWAGGGSAGLHISGRMSDA